MDVDSDRPRALELENTHRAWIHFKELRATASSYNWHHPDESTAPRSIGTSEPTIPKQPFPSYSPWLEPLVTSQGPFRLFGEAIPDITAPTMNIAVSTIASLLNHHYKLLLASTSTQTNLAPLAKQFEAEMRLLSAHFIAKLPSLDSSTTVQLMNRLNTEFKLLLERSEASENDPPILTRPSFSLRFFLAHLFGSCYHRHNEHAEIKHAIDSYSIEALKRAAKWATFLCRASPDDIRTSAYIQNQIRFLQLIFHNYAAIESEDTKGRQIWQLLAHIEESLPGESVWSLLLLCSALNTSKLFGVSTLQYYANWDVVYSLLSRDLLQAPKSGRNSPTKDPQGPSSGIQDLVQRLKYFQLTWGPPNTDITALLTRYFSQRLPSCNPSLAFCSRIDLAKSSNAFDAFLWVLVDSVYTPTTMQDRKCRLALAKNIESFLNVLEDLPTTNLHPDTEVPALLRNAFQFSIAVLPVMSDSDAETILLERLFSITFEHLSPLARKIALQGMFQILAAASNKATKTGAHTNKQHSNLAMELEDLYGGDLDMQTAPGHTNILPIKKEDPKEDFLQDEREESFLPLPRTRKRIVAHLNLTLQSFITPQYAALSTSSHAQSPSASISNAYSTATTHLAQQPSKRAKHLEVDFTNIPYMNAEKLVNTFFKQSCNILKHHLSAESIELAPQNALSDFVTNLSCSHSVRHHINLFIRQLILSTRHSPLLLVAHEKLDHVWLTTMRLLQSAGSLPVKTVHQLSELQGMVLYAFSGDAKKNWLEYLEIGHYSKPDAVSRSIPLYALYSWLDLISEVLKQNVYTETVVSSDMGVIALTVLVNATLESSPSTNAILECLQRCRDLVICGPSGKLPLALEFLSGMIDNTLVDVCQRNAPPGTFSQLLVSSVLQHVHRPTSKFADFKRHLPLLVRHIDDIIISCRTELAASGRNTGRLSAYDDSVYPFVSLLLRLSPHWLYTRTNVRYNVFGRLTSELFIAPIRAMAIANSDPSPSSLAHTPGSNLTPPVPTTGIAPRSNIVTSGDAHAKAASGMIFGKNRTKPKSTSSTPNLASPSPQIGVLSSTTRAPLAPSQINDNAIRHLPTLLHAIAHLDFSTDADLQRYTCDIVANIFKCFSSGQDGNYDARLVEQFATGLTAFQPGRIDSLSSEASESASAFLPSNSGSLTASGTTGPDASKIRAFRAFFLANILPWLIELMDKASEETLDTNAFVVSRMLAWMMIKLKHASEPAVELVTSFLMSVYYILDLFRARKPTKSALAKKEMLGYVTIFCSTILKVAPHASPMHWLRSLDVHLHDLLDSALKGVVVAITRDLEYIANAKWPGNSVREATLHTALRMEHVNGLFQRTVDHTVALSNLALLDRQGSIDGLKAEAKALIEVLDFIRQIGAPHLITEARERIRAILYLPEENMAQRHARADIKAALEVARKDFGKLSYLLSNDTSTLARS